MFPMFALTRVRSCAGEARRATRFAKIASADRASTSLCAQRGVVGQGNFGEVDVDSGPFWYCMPVNRVPVIQ